MLPRPERKILKKHHTCIFLRIYTDLKSKKYSPIFWRLNVYPVMSADYTFSGFHNVLEIGNIGPYNAKEHIRINGISGFLSSRL